MPFSLPVYTPIHGVFGLVGVFAGLVVGGGLMAGVRSRRWVGLFLATAEQ